MYNYSEYKKKEKEVSDNNFANDYKDYIKSSVILNDIPDDFKIESSNEAPIYMISQITGNPISNDHSVISSTGIIYDKDEYLQYIYCNKEPICINTGILLTDTTEEILDLI